MSLEQQIGALVKASENLTGAVNGKIGEIDKKVNEAVTAIPKLGREFYIDAINGNDMNTGTQNNPICSIREAFRRTINVPFITIYLKSGQVHEYIGQTDTFIYWEISGVVRFYKYGSGDFPIFLPKITQYGGLAAINFFAIVDGGCVYFDRIHIKIPNETLAGYEGVGSFGCGLFTRAHGGRFISGSIMMSLCKFELSAKYWGVVPLYASIIELILFESEIIYLSNDGNAKFLDAATSTVQFVVVGSSYSSSLVSWKNMVKGVLRNTSGMPFNIVSNVNFE